MLAWTIAAMVVGSAMPGPAVGAAVTITSSKFGNLFHDAEPATFDVNVISGFASVDGVLVTDVQDPYGRIVLHDQHPVSIVWSSATQSLTIGSALKGRFAVTAKLYDEALNRTAARVRPIGDRNRRPTTNARLRRPVGRRLLRLAVRG